MDGIEALTMIKSSVTQDAPSEMTTFLYRFFIDWYIHRKQINVIINWSI